MIPLMVIGAVLLILVLWIVAAYNNLVILRLRFRKAFA